MENQQIEKINDLVVSYNGKKVPDSEVHKLAEKLGINTHEVESYIYSLASKYLKEHKVKKSIYVVKKSVLKKAEGSDKVSIVMREFEQGKLKDSSGKVVTDKDQALAIAYSEAKKAISGDEVVKDSKYITDKVKARIDKICKRFGVSKEKIVNQLKAGIDVEGEHKENMNETIQITLDHLEERPDYYDRLSEMENEPIEKTKKGKC